jgi:hypothetical protein
MTGPKEIAAALLPALNAAAAGEEFTQTFTAQRGYLPNFQLKDVAALRVIVVPRGQTFEQNDETGWSREIAIDVGFLRKLPGRPIETGFEDNADIDGLMQLVTDVADWLLDVEVLGFQVSNVENDPIYDPEHMREWRQFTSVVTVTLEAIE